MLAAVQRLDVAGIATARLDAEILMATAIGQDRAWLMTRWNEKPDETTRERFASLVARREKKEPVAYIVGEKEFYGRGFIVSPDVLIPRPETELLIEKALSAYSENLAIAVCDLGTGSGAIAVTLAAERPNQRLNDALNREVIASRDQRQTILLVG